MPKFMRKAVILVKLEVTPGVDPTPTGLANALFVKNFNLTPLDGDEVEHEHLQPHFGNFDSELATAWSKVDFDVYLAGSGTAGVQPQYDPLLQACACGVNIVEDVSVTYAPVSNNIKTVTIYVNIDGVNHALTYSRGNVAATTDAKGLPVLKFSMTGLFNPVADTVLPVPTYTNNARALPVNKANTVLSLHGIALAATNFGFDFGNQVVYRNLIGSESVHIPDRKSTYSTTFEAASVATKDWTDLAKKGTTGALSLIHGVGAGNIITFSSAKANVMKPSISDSEGIQMNQVNGRLIPSATGNDEWSLAFT